MSNSFRRSTLSMKLADNFDALLLDCDGVIAETERDVHRVSFNKAFKAKGLTCLWDEKLYGELLKIGGGKERMITYFNEVGWPSSVSTDKVEREAFIAELHKLKTANFQSVVEGGGVELRPGVMRLVDDALVSGLHVAVCSTSNENAVTTIVRQLLGERFCQMPIYAGDIVKKKKPAPDVYLKAAQKLEVDPSRCWVVEDSGIGLAAAKAAGMKCCITISNYTRETDFSSADIITEDLDHGPDGPISIAWMNYMAGKDKSKSENCESSNADLFGTEPNYAGMFSKVVEGKGMGLPF